MCACRKNGWGWSPLDFRWRHQLLSIVLDIAIEALLSRLDRPRFLAGEEVADDRCDFMALTLEREMTGIE